MPVTIAEKFDSQEATAGDNASVDLRYVVQGTDDDAVVQALLVGTAPLTYSGLVVQSLHYAPLGGDVWDCSARYGKIEPRKAGDSSFNFDTGGGTSHTTQSLETINQYSRPGFGPAPDFKGAIGVSADKVEGTDITTPVFNFTETHYVPAALVTPAYKAALFFLTGKVNNAPFKGFAAGEVLFLGASGSQRGVEDWEITFRFAASPNVVDLQVGDIIGIAKKGWEYLWVRYADAEDANVLVKQPQAAYVEKVYEEGNFAGLGIGV